MKKTVFLLSALFLFPAILGNAEPTQKPYDRSNEAMNYEKATFAGGCFWCMEPPFENLDGVIEVVSGYTGGNVPNPTYEQVSSGGTGHTEAIQITFDPKRISYEKLLEVFWRQIDPTDDGGSFVDRGTQYRSGIFYHSEEQKKLAETSKRTLQESGKFAKPIATEISKATAFYPAEDYHQDYHSKNPVRYKYYRYGSGRDAYIEETWQTDSNGLSEDELRMKLTPLQYEVTQENGTEPPFKNEFWDNHREGIYVDIVSGEPLFSSRDKFDSGTGWPSFTKTLEKENVIEKIDRSFFMKRTEVRSKQGDSHLGHLFPDGPKPTGLRYCINSASLRFIPKEDLEKEGYGKYRSLFPEK